MLLLQNLKRILGKQNKNIVFRNLCCPSQCPTKSTNLKEVLKEKIASEQKKIKAFVKEQGSTKVGDVNVSMIYGGMRGIIGLIWEPSHLDPEEGIRFRGYSIPEIQCLLPKAQNSCQPLPEGIFWLLATGDIPTIEQTTAISHEWSDRSKLPDYVEKCIKCFPKNMHPMAQLSSALNMLSTDSHFAKAYHKGVKKTEYWEYVYEDSMNLIARIIVEAAMIYRNVYKNSELACEINLCNDWSSNFAYMLGYDDPQFIELMRLYLTIHCDHEGGNVSAHTTHLVGSALADPYLSYAAGLNGLAGPLHGLANQEVLIWIEKLKCN